MHTWPVRPGNNAARCAAVCDTFAPLLQKLLPVKCCSLQWTLLESVTQTGDCTQASESNYTLSCSGRVSCRRTTKLYAAYTLCNTWTTRSTCLACWGAPALSSPLGLHPLTGSWACPPAAGSHSPRSWPNEITAIQFGEGQRSFQAIHF